MSVLDEELVEIPESQFKTESLEDLRSYGTYLDGQRILIGQELGQTRMQLNTARKIVSKLAKREIKFLPRRRGSKMAKHISLIEQTFEAAERTLGDLNSKKEHLELRLQTVNELLDKCASEIQK